MALPLSYSLRNLFVRRSAAIFTMIGVALTASVFAGVLSLRAGLEGVFERAGRRDVAIYLRDGATSEGESGITREAVQILIKERPEILRDADGRPLAAAEMYLAVYMEKVGGGLTNVPLRGIQPMSITLQGDAIELIAGRWPTFGSDELVVGEAVVRRMKDCELGKPLQLNVTPFQVVGVFRHAGVQNSEVWGDSERMMEALERPVYQRVVARVSPTADLELAETELQNDPRTAALAVESESGYLARQTSGLGTLLSVLAVFLTVVMSAAAIFGAINTMLANVASRTHEIGVLLAIGFSRRAVFLTFLAESALLGLCGGVLGVLIVMPFRGLETGAMNWNTFTDVAFGFEFPPVLLAQAVVLSVVLGVLGGALPALRAACMKPVDAVRTR